MNLDHYLTTYTKINSKWIKDLSIRPKTLKLLEENTDSKLLDFSLGYDFWDLTPKAKATKAKNKCNYIKLKLLHSKETNKLKMLKINVSGKYEPRESENNNVIPHKIE